MTPTGRTGPPTLRLHGFEPSGPTEADDVAIARRLLASPAGWDRLTPMHLTASAVVVDPMRGKVLLRWHARLRRWAQVGGHADEGETDPLQIALREAREETGLPDLEPWPTADVPKPVQVVRVPVPASPREPAHEHADIRYAFATRLPEAARAESEDAPLKWVSAGEARDLIDEPNLVDLLVRVFEWLP